MYLFVIDFDDNTCSKYVLDNPSTDFETTLDLFGHNLNNCVYIHTEKDLLDYKHYRP
jgi:hypothetical protein|tara:strand:+ start:551 stop:721 length:171 start_codon:yes stop_codon:yes gene_type:complete